MPDFLLELLSEEIPARMQAKARADLARLFEGELTKAGLKAEAIETFSTPRRLVLIARNLPLGTAALNEEIKGPRTSAPPQALEGFLRKTGLTEGQLTDRDGIWFAVVEKPGRATAGVLAEAIPAIVRAFPWPKSMRWGAASLSTESLRWVRPLQGIVAMLDEEVIDFEIGDVRSSAATIGHRFHHPGPITLAGAKDYIEKLRACHVIVDHDERAKIIREGAARLAEPGELVADEGLVQENAGLTELPVPYLGKFESAFLDLPPELLQLTMRTNQKYFAVGKDRELWSRFVFVANIETNDPAAMVGGYEKVLAARLSDARFFWEQDLKIPLEEQAAKLSQIVFHEKLGTVADKVERVAKLARWLVEEGIVGNLPSPQRGEGGEQSEPGEGLSSLEQTLTLPLASGERAPPSPLQGEGQDLATLAERAARLCKADLVTQMVGEFPELQGLIGGYLAQAQGEDPQVAAAIRDHYKPVGQGDEVPTAPVTVAVSLADKLDTLVSFFSTAMFPTGSRDPFALRRAAISLLRLELENDLGANWGYLITRAYIEVAGSLLKQGYSRELHRQFLDELAIFEGKTRDTLSFEEEVKLVSRASPNATKIIPFENVVELTVIFFIDRLEAQQRSGGTRADIVSAVFSFGGEFNVRRILARVRALQAFVETPEGADLLAGYKRAANILKKEGWASDPSPGTGEGGEHSEPGEGLSSSDLTLTLPLGSAERAPPSPFQGEGQGSLSYSPEKAEAALIAALDSAEPEAAAAVEREDFEGAMRALAKLRGPVDAFFNEVIVNDPNDDKRTARLNLLARIRGAVHRVADFSRIEG